MGRRRNGSGTLYKRGAVYYAQLKVGGRVLRLSTGTTDRRRALARLDSLARGCDLGDAERLAAVETALSAARRDIPVDTAWKLYLATPAQKPKCLRAQRASWLRLVKWARGGLADADGAPVPPKMPRLDSLADIDEATAARFAADIGCLYAPLTVADTVSALSQIWRALNATPNPWRDLPRQAGSCQPRLAFTDAEIRAIVEAASGELRLLLLIGVYTGLRVSDAVALRWESVAADLGAITLRPIKTLRSSGVSVTIPVHPALRAALGTHGGTGPVLPRLASISKSSVHSRLNRLFARCGIQTRERRDGYRYRVALRGFHSFRAAFVTRLADAGVPLPQIQSLVGHMSPKMTLHYYRASAEASRRAVESLPDICVISAR